MEFHERLKIVREKQKIDLENLAKDLDISTEEIISWENGEEEPSIDNLIKLSKIYRTSTDYLLTGKSSSDFFFKILMLVLSVITLGVFLFVIIAAIRILFN
ncbi:MAG: helix-turn-helix transcriptional regulator [Miniphocaeibacter sp.]|uniref:helix-turn-helix domain-containing protein n=1 Tax=Miniphocaeibacter sp. TaxID=3100973 RepID=UPI0017CFADCA|nr:helix-turn-helix transcriptional regulator [Gallicola sp.]